MVLLSSDYIWSIIFSFGHPSFRWLKEVQRLYKVRFKELGIFSLEKRKYSRRQSGCLKYLKACFWKWKQADTKRQNQDQWIEVIGRQVSLSTGEKNQGCLKVDLGSLGGANGFPIAGGSEYLLGRHSIQWIHVFRLSRCLDYEIDL